MNVITAFRNKNYYIVYGYQGMTFTEEITQIFQNILGNQKDKADKKQRYIIYYLKTLMRNSQSL